MLPFVLLVVASVIDILFALFVYLKNPASRTTSTFALLCITLGGWALTNAFVIVAPDDHWTTFWARATFVCASLIPLAFYFFVEAFPYPTNSFPRRRDILLSSLSLVTAALSFTPQVASSATSHMGLLKVTYGPLHPFFAVYLLATIAFGIATLARRFLTSHGVQRLQLQYLALGITLTALGGVAANLLAPIITGTSRFSRFGPVFSLILVAFTAHSIIRHRLMNLRLVVRHGTTYFLTTLALGVAFVLLANSSSTLLASTGNADLAQPAQILLVLALAILYQPIKRHLQSAVDRYFFRESYNYHNTVREASRVMTSTLNLHALLNRAALTLTRALRPEYLAIYSLNSTQASYSCLHLATDSLVEQPQPPSEISTTHQLVMHLHPPTLYLATDELQRDTSFASQKAYWDLLALPAALAVPITEGSNLTGFLLVGRKLSGDPYFPEDVDLLLTLIPHLSTSLKNATLYSQLHLAHEFLENILTAMDSGVIAVDLKGKITLSNAAAHTLLHLPASACLNAHASLLPRPLRDPIFHTLASRHAHRQLEIAVPGPQQQPVPLLVSSSCLHDASGDLLGAVAVFNDLSRLKQLEVDKRRIERLAAIGALASGIAHEVRNPLVAIRTFAELLPERFQDEEFRHTFARLAVSEIDRIDRLVASLRGLAIDTNQSFDAVDLRRIAEDTLALLQPRFERQEIEVDYQWSTLLPQVLGDQARLRQLFLNLLVNALDAMPAGGKLSLTARVVSREDTPAIAIEITDTGPGLPDHLLNEVFEPFVTTKPYGAGLGLSICRGIADAHRATLTARNNGSRVGATFAIEFPLTISAAKENPPANTSSHQLALELPGLADETTVKGRP